jgi:hypothetical protein
MADTYYLRFRGLTLGPFTEAQVHEMIKRGRVSRSTEASMDQQIWRPLAAWPQFFPSAGLSAAAGQLVTPDVPKQIALGVPQQPSQSAALEGSQGTGMETTPSGSTQKIWYVARGNKAQPVAEGELISEIRAGLLAANSLVWTEEFTDWQPIVSTRLAKFLPQSDQAKPPIEASLPGGTPGLTNEQSLFSHMAIIAANQCAIAGRVANILGIILGAFILLGTLMLMLAVNYATARTILFVALLLDVALITLPILGLWVSSKFDATARTRSAAQAVMAVNRLKIYWVYLAVVYGGCILIILMLIIVMFLFIAAGADALRFLTGSFLFIQNRW